MSPFNPQHQALATAVLQAPTGPARDELAALLVSTLLPLAERRVRDAPDLRRFGDAADLVQDFMAQTLRPGKLAVLLGRVAAGQRPLLPRVKCSFVNFLYSLLRRPVLPEASTPLGTGEGEFDPAARPDHWPAITERVADQLAAIREARPALSAAVPLHAVLLLDERLRLARAIAESFAPEDGKTVGHQTVADLAEAVAEWTAAEAAQPLPPQGTPLGRAWQAVLQQTQDRPQEANSAHVAQVLGLSRGTWNTWVSRGRTRLAQRLGPARARALFPHWPPGPFEQPDAGAEEAGHV